MSERYTSTEWARRMWRWEARRRFDRDGGIISSGQPLWGPWWLSCYGWSQWIRPAYAEPRVRAVAWRGLSGECKERVPDGRCNCGDPEESADPPGYCALRFGGDR